MLGAFAVYFYQYMFIYSESEFSNWTVVRIQEWKNTVVDASVYDRICIWVMKEDKTDTCWNDRNWSGDAN